MCTARGMRKRSTLREAYFALAQSPFQVRAISRFQRAHKIRAFKQVWLRAADNEIRFFEQASDLLNADLKIWLRARRKTQPGKLFVRDTGGQFPLPKSSLSSHCYRLLKDTLQMLRMLIGILGSMLWCRFSRVRPVLVVGNILEARASTLSYLAQFLGSVVAVDDGSATLKVIQARNEKLRKSSDASWISRRERKRANQVGCLTLFTIFNAESTSRTAILQDTLWERVTVEPDYYSTWLVGPNFVSLGHLSIREYLELLEEVCGSLPGREISYWVHRGEPAQVTNQVAHALGAGVQIRPYDGPLEDQARRVDRFPTQVIMFPSTPAFTLPLLVPEFCMVRVVKVSSRIDPRKSYSLRLVGNIEENVFRSSNVSAMNLYPTER